MGTVPRVLVRRTASPVQVDFGGLSSGTPSVVVQLDVVPLPPSSSVSTVVYLLFLQEQIKGIIIIGLSVGWISCWS
jgi:hypothetical protein